jgi:hypothetical protein
MKDQDQYIKEAKTMPQMPYGQFADVTARYAGMLGRDFEGTPWNNQYQGYGQTPISQMPGAINVPTSNIQAQLLNAKKTAAAQVATSDITALPNAKVGVPRALIIDGSTLFGNTAVVGALLVNNVDVLVNTYTVQPGYQVILDDTDPLQMAMIRPYGSDTATTYIDCICKVDVAEAATGDGVTVFLQSTIMWRPDQNFASGDRFNKRWQKKYVCEGNDLIRTFLRLNASQAAQTVSAANSRIAHETKCWKVIS